MSKSFLLLLFCWFILICYLFCDFWTLIIIVFVFFTLIKCILIWFESQLNFRRKPGTVSYSKVHLISKRYYKTDISTKKTNKCKYLKVYSNKSEDIVNSKHKINLKAFKRQINHSSFDSGVFSQSCQTEMSFFKSSNSSLSLLDSSPVRRPLRIRNGDQLEGSPIRNTSLTTLSNTSVNEGRSPSGNMSVGEFPLISLVSSLHEAVSPKPHRLQPSPVRIRIKPVQQTEQMAEPVADPVVSVLKQIASNKRILAPSNVVAEEEQREKKSRSMPRHDLTHSLLESQLTINSNREVGGNSSKREREETICASSTPCGIQSASAAKRMCAARTLRSNEILSSLSSSISLVSPPSNKSYTGKRKSVTFDKYKKVRRIEEGIQVKPTNLSPVKVDKSVTTQPPEEKSPLPVISIKRDVVSERVVSRAMVSALLKSTVAKLIMSGDPAVYPVPNGTQSRQPEVTPTEFGPPKPPPTLTTTPSLSSAILLPPASDLTFSMPQSDKTTAVVSSAQLSSPGFNFGSNTSSATSSATSHTLTTSVQSLSAASSTPAQPLFSVNKPQVSTAAVPTFGLSMSTGVTTPSISTAQGVVSSTPSVVSTAPPSFSIPSSTILSTSGSPAIPVFGSAQTPAKTPTFGLTTSSNPTTVPTFGLSSSVVSTAMTTPTFSFGNSSTNETKTTTSIAPPSFASVVASSTPSFGLPVTTTPAMPTTASSSLFSPVATSNAPTVKFGSSTNVTAPVFGAPTTSTIAPPTFGGALPTSSTVTSTAATPVFGSASNTSTSLFGSNLSTVKAATPSTTAPSTVFGAATPVFGSTTSTTAPVFGANTPTTTSSNIFGANPTPAFGSNLTTSAPVFGSSTVTTTAPLFGGPTNTATTSLFGSFTNTNTTTSTPLFGAASTTTSAPLFGSGASTTTAAPLFGAGSATAAPIFGASNSPAPVFGASATKTTTTPVFGGSSSSATSSTPLFGGTTTTTSQAPMFGSNAPSFTSSGFGSSSAKSSEGLFGMPSSNSGFKASTPFQVGGTDGGNTASAFGTSSAGTAGKTFEFGSSKPSSGGFTFKPSTTVTAFSSQPAAPQQPAATPFNQQPQQTQQAPFSFAGAASSSTSANTGGSPFVFGTPQSQTAAPAPGAKPFQFGTGTPGGAAPAFGQSFAPTFGQSPAAPNVSFGTPATPANAGFQFNTPQQPAPGAAGGLFSIGTGSTGSRNRDRRDRRRRV